MILLFHWLACVWIWLAQVPQWNSWLYEVCGSQFAEAIPASWDAVSARWLDVNILEKKKWNLYLRQSWSLYYFALTNSSLWQMCCQPERAVQTWHESCAGLHLFPRPGLQKEHLSDNAHSKAFVTLNPATHTFSNPPNADDLLKNTLYAV